VDKQLCIAIDGPASSGKGTVARLVAQHLKYAYIDSGAMYRSVALAAQEQQVEWSDDVNLIALVSRLEFGFKWDGETLQILLNGRNVTQDIRQEAIGRGASDVATHEGVRRALLEQQRALSRSGGVVMDGRDIGTVVLPNAEVKIFLDADVDERAMRRHRELTSKGIAIDYATIRADVIRRDDQDRNRATAPLAQAEDAIYLNTTGMSPDEAARRILEIARALA